MMVASMSRAALDDEAERIELPVDLAKSPIERPSLWIAGEIARSRRSRASPRPGAGRKSGGTTADRAPPPRRPDQRACAIAAEERSEHRQRRIARHARRRAMDRRKQILERRPVEPLLDPVQKSANLAQSRSPSRLRRKLGTGHDATSAKHPLSSNPENQILPTSAKISEQTAGPLSVIEAERRRENLGRATVTP